MFVVFALLLEGCAGYKDLGGGSLACAPDGGSCVPADSACVGIHSRSEPALVSRDASGLPWFATGGSMRVNQEGIITDLAPGGVSVELAPPLGTLELSEVEGLSLSLSVGDPVWVDARSVGGAGFEAFAWYVTLERNPGDSPLVAVYRGNEQILSGFGVVIGTPIELVDACSYANNSTCFETERTVFLALKLSADEALEVTSGSKGQLVLGGETFTVIISHATRFEATGPAKNCGDVRGGVDLALHVLAQ